MLSMKRLMKSASAKSNAASTSSNTAAASTTPASGPPVSPVATTIAHSFSFNEEDDASQRDQFERVVSASASEAFDMFSTFVWRENAAVGLNPESWIEIVKDSKVPGQLEVGMSRVVAG